ncbi:dienelactone hydrolase family protein [Microbacterium sp. STN6]|uniref:dienelactone hydrolase family protein n=1 Tax=Microbacterium sp. STN6 TaxID=2995588 RepID=UPI002260AFEF|nr:dienelactone hydrolase family protein [Microbacterium sp. STN6]MCX7521365.1 dienelactone hydrolase family protein [Microbacterium sp. STN6]
MTLSPAHEELLATVPLSSESRIETSDVAYGHEEAELEGYFAYDAAAERPLPGVLIVHDWTGVGDTVKMRAQMLARLGFAAFAADVYGRGIRPQGADASATARGFYADLPLLRARVAAGFAELAANTAVDSSRLAVIGYCFGGSAALEFARTGADARGVVSLHGGLIAHDPSDASAIRASLLILTGGADPVVPDTDIAAFQDELRAAGDIDWQVTTYSGAPHAFTVPGPNYRPTADARAWHAMLAFLHEVLAAPPVE